MDEALDLDFDSAATFGKFFWVFFFIGEFTAVFQQVSDRASVQVVFTLVVGFKQAVISNPLASE